MKKIMIFTILAIIPLSAWTQEFRSIELEYSHNLSVENSSKNFRTIYRVAEDSYYNLVDPRLPDWSKGFASFAFTFGATYLNILWSHEFGHWFRAKEVGGSFNIHNISITYPYQFHIPH